MKQTVIAISVFFSFTVLALAAPGDLDLTFNGTGKVVTNFSTNAADSAYGRAVAVQPDNKIITAGYYWLSGVAGIAVARYNPDGSLDTSFDGDGRVLTAISNNSLFAYAVAVQNDGKILVAGVSDSTQSRFFVARYNTDGSLDTSFDTDGIAYTPVVVAGGVGKTGLAIQSDGKIVVAGTCYFPASWWDFCVARFNDDGSMDSTFDTDGVVSTSTTPLWDYGYAVAIQADNKIVVAGQSRNDTDGWDQISVVRYNPDGTLDATFDGDGILTQTVGTRNGSDGGRGIAIQSDNKIVIAGFASFILTHRDFAILRYNSDGSLDTTFDTDGIVTTTISSDSSDEIDSVVIQPDGKIIAAGSSSSPSYWDFAIVRYNADGSLDSSFAENVAPNAFGNGGKVTVDFAGGEDTAYGVKLDSFGKVVAAGTSANSIGVKHFGTVRLHGLGPTSASVSISGRVLTADGRGLRNAVVALTDGNGNTRTTRTSTFGYYRFDEIETGQTVTINVRAKRFQFEPRILSVNEDLADVDFIPITEN